MDTVTVTTNSANEREYQDKVYSLLALAAGCKVTDQDSASKAADTIKLLAEMEKRLDEDCKALTRPLDSLKKEIRERYEPLRTELKTARANVKSQCAVYLSAKAREEELRRAEARIAELKRIEALPKEIQDTALMKVVEDDSVPVSTTVRGDYGSSGGIRKTWTFEIEDDRKIPREYLAVDEKMIRAQIRNGVRGIPGVRIFQREDLVVR